MFDLGDLPEAFFEEPAPFYDALLEGSGLCWQADGSVIVSRHADLEAIYKDTDRFVSDKRAIFAPKFGAGSPLFDHHTTSLVFNDPPLHTRVRRIISGALTPRAIARMEAGLSDTVDALLDQITGEVDLIEAFASRIPIQIIGNLLDIPMDERGPLRDWSLDILGALEPRLSSEQLRQGHAAVEAFTAYLRDLVARRRARPGDPETDVLTRLIAGDAEGQLSETELLQNCVFILNAGHETTTNLIGNGLALLNDHPEVREGLLADPSKMALAVEEVLRVASPNQFGNRQTAVDVQMRGDTIPAGTNVHLCIGAANRDGSVFERPEVFDIARKPNRHLAFAGGPHVCVGLALARLEGRVALRRFLARFPDCRIVRRKQGGRVRFRGFAELYAQMEGAA